MLKKVNLLVCIKNFVLIFMLFIFFSLERIEIVSCVMEFRVFGNKKKCIWYSERKFKKNDYILMIVLLLLFFIFIIIIFKNGSRFYNFFI